MLLAENVYQTYSLCEARVHMYCDSQYNALTDNPSEPGAPSLAQGRLMDAGSAKEGGEVPPLALGVHCQ